MKMAGSTAGLAALAVLAMVVLVMGQAAWAGLSTPRPPVLVASPAGVMVSSAVQGVTSKSEVAYGPGIAADGMAGTQVGGTTCGCPNLASAYRFRAGQSSALVSVRVYVVKNLAGYSGGTGGSLEVSVQTDAGGVPSGTVLATTLVPQPARLSLVPQILFPSPASLTAGQRYHLTFRNSDPAPTENFVSIDGLYVDAPAIPRRQPRFDDGDWAQLMNDGSGWVLRPSYTPILALSYANWVDEGVGYMEVWAGAQKPISGVARAREAFTVSGLDRTISSASVRLARVAGASPLTVRLEQADGTLLAAGTIPAADIPIAESGDEGVQATWATTTFATAVRLQKGTSYHLVLSAPADTTYSLFVLRKGVGFGFPSATYFADGHAQYDSGTGWIAFGPGWTEALDEADLQLYFR